MLIVSLGLYFYNHIIGEKQELEIIGCFVFLSHLVNQKELKTVFVWNII